MIGQRSLKGIAAAGVAIDDYRRHTFSSVVPEGDPGAGVKIDMQQLNDEEVLVSVGGGEAKLWRRSEVIS